MSVTDGQNADAATFNAAFASKSADNTLTGKQTLNRTGSGASITDVQQAINDVTASDALKIPLSQKGAANGVATLDASTQIPTSQIPTLLSTKISDFNAAADDRIFIQKGAISGIAPLNASAQIDSTYLPSYVDDVVEVANYAALPAIGESGKIYLTLDTNKSYRWSGSVYINIGQPIASTDDVAEGSTNLYFTAARVADKQIGIQFQDEGSNLGTSATVTAVDFTGAGVTATRSTNKVTVNIAGAGTGTVPAGTILPYGGSTAPSGYLLCDGTAYSRSSYADLFAVINTSFGNGDGSTTFNVPDLRYNFLRGYGPQISVTGSGSASSNNATFTAHGINRTGFRVRKSSGTLTGLSASTDYYAIVVDANTLAFATTYANAIAGTKIAISGSNTAVIVQYEETDNTSRIGSVGGSTGSNIGSRQLDQMQGHYHSSTVIFGSTGGGNQAGNIAGGTNNNTGTGTGYTSSPYTDGTNGTPRTGYETRPQNVYVNHIIKA